MSAPSFSLLELQVNDLSNLAQINGRLFEELMQHGGPSGNWICNHQTYLLLSFMVGELCGRTTKLEKDYEAALDAYQSERTGGAK